MSRTLHTLLRYGTALLAIVSLTSCETKGIPNGSLRPLTVAADIDDPSVSSLDNDLDGQELEMPYRADDPAQALEMYKDAADKGDNEARFEIGMAYLSAKHVNEAEAWLKRAAEGNYMAAQLALAQIYLQSHKPEDEQRGAEWIRRAADAGDANAQLALALLYQQERGVEKDNAQVEHWLGKAATRNETAKFQLGLLYYDAGDYTRAAQNFMELAHAGHAVAQYNLGGMYQDGKGVPKSNAKAAVWFTIALRGYPPGAQRDEVAQQLNVVRASLAPADDNEAKSLYEQITTTLPKPKYAIKQNITAEDTARQSAEAGRKQAKQRFGLAGSVQTGLRWQSNGSGASHTLLTPTARRPAEDTNLFVLGNVNWSADTGSDRIVNLDSRVQMYQAYQSDSDNLNIGYMQLSTGPNILYDKEGQSTFRPYLTSTIIQVDGENYESAFGLGLGTTLVFSNNTALLLSAEENWTHYNVTPTFTQNAGYSGTQDEYSARLMQRLEPWLTADVSMLYDRNEARASERAYDSFKIANGYAIRLPAITSLSARPLRLYTAAAYLWRDYDAADLTIANSVARSDKEWSLLLSAELPMDTSWSLLPSIQTVSRDSSMGIYEYKNTSASVAVMYRF
jgi:TPR repeat protein